MRNDIGGIALVGEPGSGKTSIANALAMELGWERLSFAAALKDEVAQGLFGTDVLSGRGVTGTWRSYTDPMAAVKTKDAYRPLLQAWGSFRRAQDVDYWVDRLEIDMVDGRPYVIDDCRYNNEYDMLRRRGFKFVYLVPGETTRPLTAEQFDHESERDWPHFGCDLVLTYQRGPEAQAQRILMFFGLGQAAATEPSPAFIVDSLPEDDCPTNCVCKSEPENCNRDGCTDGYEDATVLPATRREDKGVLSIHLATPYHGEIRFSPPLSQLSVEYADDEPVWAVPA